MEFVALYLAKWRISTHVHNTSGRLLITLEAKERKARVGSVHVLTLGHEVVPQRVPM